MIRPGGDLLSRALRRSTIGAEGFHGRVRNGIGCIAPRCGHQAKAKIRIVRFVTFLQVVGVCCRLARVDTGNRHSPGSGIYRCAGGWSCLSFGPKPSGEIFPLVIRLQIYPKIGLRSFSRCQILLQEPFRESVKPIELLVLVSFTHCCASTPSLSTWWSSTALRRDLVSRGASHLDAFSGYPFRT